MWRDDLHSYSRQTCILFCCVLAYWGLGHAMRCLQFQKECNSRPEE